MNAVNDGGPAFPAASEQGNGGNYFTAYQPGMSLRDYFAAKAMQALVSACDSTGTWTANWPDDVPAYAYAMADAMLAARGQTP